MDATEQTPGLLARLKSRLKRTGDSEPEQALIRVAVGVVLVTYFCIPWGADVSFADIIASPANQIILPATLFAIGIFAAIVINPRPSPLRRITGIFFDLTSLSIIMYWTGGDHVPLFVFYLWVTLGNGFRYGNPYLYLSFVVSLIGFGTVTYTSDYWQANQSFAVSLLVVLLVLPLYASVLIRKLNIAIDSAKQANEAKSRFLANMSHELRTPLNGVIGIGELLRESDLSNEQRKLAEMMHSSAHTLLELIEGVLDIAKIEAGKITIKIAPLDLHALVNSVIYMLAPMGAEKNIHVSCSIDPDTPFSLEGDQQHLRQVLVNLVNNAIKFTDHGSVNLHVYQCAGDTNKPVIRFDVIDTGIGIEPEALATIFDDFTQAQLSSSRKFEGTGLGTAISKELVELMDGRIGVKSELNKGSTFWCEIPFSAIEQTDDALLNNHVLLVAAQETAEIIRPSLKDWRVDFDWVQSTARALTLLLQAAEQGNHYHTVIVDQAALTNINPEQFAQMIRAENMLKNLSLVLVNSSDTMININKVNQYYITTLITLEKRLLYNAIHAAQSVQFNDENVVSLADHYGRRAGDRELKILIAEDNSVNQQVLRGILNHVGHQVQIVETGEQVLDTINDDLEQFDLVILDKNMPEKSGVEVVKTLRFLDASHSLPIIMLTADATPEAREECVEAGADAFLTKPVDAKALLEKIALLTNQPQADSKKPELPRRQAAAGSTTKDHAEPADMLVDPSVLAELARLGDSQDFIKDLVYDFIRDGNKHIQRIKQASRDDYLEYREALHALKGSSTELGAQELAAACLTGEAFKPYQMGSLEISGFVSEIDAVFRRTEAVLASAVKDLDYNRQQRPE